MKAFALSYITVFRTIKNSTSYTYIGDLIFESEELILSSLSIILTSEM